MVALAFDGRTARVIERAATARRHGEARLRPRLCGICNTDLELARGYMGFRGVLGHEFVADVIEADDARWIGQRVVGGINCGCGTCSRCRAGQERHCAQRTVLGILGRDGALASTFDLPERNLVAVPDTVSDEAAVFAEPLAAALRVVEQLDSLHVDWSTARVAVQGDGKLGLLCALVLADHARGVGLFGRHPGRVPLPSHVTELPASDASERGFDVIVEATGKPEGLEQALSRVAPLGSVVLKTTCAGKQELPLAPIVVDEVRVIGSRCGDLAAAVAWLERARLPIRELVSSRFALAEGEHALAQAARSGVLKVLVEGGATP
ncbi:MAG: alcohol dehydrogenase catalytic domain-containing protein [Planctomycetes bacterium]|nr:alcohol dehydrogenase catalytic domain-containing protein [Planctomycetota bacterium]MCC7169846.1 alcohol dehydrogenase catalytic domain-containing protein [Planctomycetota bacterium]